MPNTIEYVWNRNAVDKTCSPMDKQKKSCCSRYRWLILILILFLTLAVVLTTVFVIQTKRNFQPLVVDMSNASIVGVKHNISIKDLLTIDTVAKSNVCEENQTMEDCVLIYNAKIIMGALILIPSPTSDNSSRPFNLSSNSTKTPSDCKALRIRRSQLSQIFDALTLEVLYNVSGVPYSSAAKAESRTQIDARSIQSKWTSPINYYISKTSGLTSPMIATIYTALSNWENNTVLRFNELSAITSTTNKSYIQFQRDDDYGCSSPVGYDRTDPTSTILIASYCGTIIGSIMHEVGHTLGYIHTQSRIDRNSYVTIATENIEPDYAANFFMWAYGTIKFLDVNFPYDFGSFMHYDSYGFSKNNLPTIIPLDSAYEKTMGQREKAAFYDYKQMNRLYFTRTDCPLMFTSNGCQNNGYLDPKTCSRCICPDGFSGTYCDQRDSNSNCGGVITNPTPYSSAQVTIQNPTPTTTTSIQQYCVFLIQSNSSGKIHLRLDSINTIKRSVCSLSSLIEVKYQSDLGLTGARWCGNTISAAWTNITAQTNTMVVIFRADNYLNTTTRNPQTSFRATVLFDADPTSVPTQTVTTTTTITTTSSSTTSTIRTTNSLTTTTTTVLSTCPPSSFRCQLSSQPTCGGCRSYEPCTAQGTQQCTAYAYQIQLIDCDKIVNGFAQCRYQFIQTSYITNCQRTILLCCPNYQLITIQSNHFCVYNPQATDLPTEWSFII